MAATKESPNEQEYANNLELHKSAAANKSAMRTVGTVGKEVGAAYVPGSHVAAAATQSARAVATGDPEEIKHAEKEVRKATVTEVAKVTIEATAPATGAFAPVIEFFAPLIASTVGTIGGSEVGKWTFYGILLFILLVLLGIIFLIIIPIIIIIIIIYIILTGVIPLQ